MAKKQPSLAELVRSEYGTREPKYSIKKAVPNTPVKGKRDFSVRVSDTGKPATAVEQEVENVFGMQPGLQRPGLIPFRRNPVTRNIEAVAPQALYDAARAFVSPSVALQGKPMDMQDEALNFAVNFTGAGAPRALAARPLEGGAVELGTSGGRRTAAPREVSSAPTTTRDFSQASFDPATYGLRKTKDLPRLEASPVGIEHFRVVPQPRKVSLQDYEGRPFIISMADRSAAGDRITRIGNSDLNFPVELQGGQDFMLDPTTGGLVWASEAAPVSNIMNLARQLHETTGQKPLYLPFRMGGEGSDFATMTGETMMSYADATLGKKDKASFNKVIKGYIPDFAGISDPKGYEQFAALPGGKRKQLQSELAVKFGEEGGGLTLPMTRAIIADPAQLDKPSFMLQNVGEIDPTREVVTATGHRTYSRGVPGEALGVLGEDVNVAQLLPELSKIYKIGDPREFRGQYADFTDYGKQLKIAEEAAMREQALRQGKTPKVYNTERGGTSKYMQSGAKFGVLTPELLRALAGE